MGTIDEYGIVQELLRYNKLAEVIKTSLQNTMDGMKGKIVLSEQLEKLGNSLFYGRIPQLWADNSYPSLKPLGGYVNDLLERLSFFKNGSIPKPHQPSGFQAYIFLQLS